jgi:hypothetical protein
MRPGDTVLGVTNEPSPITNNIHLCATQNAKGEIAVNILNTGEAVSFPLQIGDYAANVNMPANSVETIIIKL